MAVYRRMLGGCILVLAWMLLLDIPEDLSASTLEQTENFTDIHRANISEQIDRKNRSWQGPLGPHKYEKASLSAVSSTAGITSGFAQDPFFDASTGTAWPIAPGYVVTNNHVVSDSREIVLITMAGEKIPAWPVIRDEVNDLALLEVDDLNRLPPAIPLASLELGAGSEVFTIGFPRVDVLGTAPKVTNGLISKEKGLRANPASYQTTVPIQPGNSGGPLMNMNGEAVGVVKSMVGVMDETNGNIYMLENASCAQKIMCLKELIDLLPRHELALNSLPSRSDGLETLVNRIKGSILIVVAR